MTGKGQNICETDSPIEEERDSRSARLLFITEKEVVFTQEMFFFL